MFIDQLYREAKPEYVKFQRVSLGWLAIASLFLRDIDLVWLFFLLTLLGLLTGTAASPTTLLYRVVRSISGFELVRITEHHIRYYQINRAVDFIDHLMRLLASVLALALHYFGMELATWVLMGFLSVFMMLSAYFGFCLSALSYIGLCSLRDYVVRRNVERQNACPVTSRAPQHTNQNCTLARHGFVPYKRCDSCHTNIGNCLGTKFNVSLILVGVMMTAFIFETSPTVTELIIISIVAVLFWLGYQLNYATDDLAESINSNLELNMQLREYNHSLEDKVRERTAEIERLATYDMLTGLYNRFVFEKRLTEAHDMVRAGDGEYHLAFIDMDKFKRVNDTAGHLAGDRLLCDFATLLTESVEEKGIVGRLGGDEFAILFTSVSLDIAEQVCRQICAKLRDFVFAWEDETFTIGASIGLASVAVSMQDIKAVMHHADVACYQSKKGGGNQVTVHRV